MSLIDGNGDAVMDNSSAAVAKRSWQALFDGGKSALWKAATKSDSPLHKKSKARLATPTRQGKGGLDATNHGVPKDTDSFTEDDLYDTTKYKGPELPPNGNVATGGNDTQVVQMVQVTPGKAEVVVSKVVPAKSISKKKTEKKKKAKATIKAKTKCKVGFSHTEEIPMDSPKDKEAKDHDGNDDDDDNDDNIPDPPATKSYATAAAMQAGLEAHFETIPPKNAGKTRKHKLFITIRHMVEKSSKDKTNGDPTSQSRAAAVKAIFDMMKKFVDKKVVLYRYMQQHDNKCNGVVKASEIPTNVTKLMEYGTSLRGTPNRGTRFSSFRVGFNVDPRDFLDMLFEEAKCRNMWVKKHALQVAETVPLGFVAYLTRDHDAEALADHINYFSEHCIHNRNTEPAKFGAEIKMIWDGASEDVRVKRSEKEKNDLRAIHIIGPKQGKGRAWKVLKAFFQSPYFKDCYNAPFKVIRAYRKNETLSYMMNYKEVVGKHKFYAQTQTKWTDSTSAFTEIDKPINLLDSKPSIHKLLMSMKDSKGKPLFLSVELCQFGHFRGQYRATYVKGKSEDAADRKAQVEGTWQFIAKYFQNEFGESSLMHFTQEAIEEADTMGWDDELGCLISIDDLELKEALNDGDTLKDIFDTELDMSKLNVDDVEVEHPDSLKTRMDNARKDFPTSTDEDSLRSFQTYVLAATEVQPPKGDHSGDDSDDDDDEEDLMDKDGKPNGHSGKKGTQATGPAGALVGSAGETFIKGAPARPGT